MLGEVPEGAVQIGPSEWYTVVTNTAGSWIGIDEWHRQSETGDLCGGWVPFEPYSSHGWTVNSSDPLDLSPSLLCTVCQHHGFIRQGKWVSA